MTKKEIKGYDQLYFIDTFGNVYDKLGNKIKPKKYANEYSYVTLRKGGEDANRLVHKLLAEAFIPNPKKKLLVNHKDLNRCNNSLSNLEWCTHSENQFHHLEMRKGGKIKK
jgi:hypothetical protein